MKNYLPMFKGDLNAINYLKTLPLEEVRSDIPELLIWFQDLNWGMANDIAEFLVPYINEIKDEIIIILNGSDAEWKRGILSALVAEAQKEIDSELLSIVKRIAEYPNKAELEESVDSIAKKILSKVF